jgi:MFS family permease
MALTVLAISQLMVVLDATIVNVALERIQVALGFTSQSDLQWIVTGYALTFGGFLLLGGKLADRLGRRGCSSPARSCSPWPRCSAASPRASRCSSPPAPCRASAARSCPPLPCRC